MPPARARNHPSAARKPLSRERIVAAAIQLADDRGDFSMRGLGTRLRVDPMAIYRHFRDKDALLNAMVDVALADLRAPARDSGTPIERLRRMCTDFRAAVAAHPGVASRIETGRPTLGPHSLGLTEATLGILHEIGLDDRDSARAYISLVRFIVGVVVAEEQARATGDEATRREEFRAAYASVPPESFPNVARLTSEMADAGVDDQLAFGLDLLIEGIERRGGASDAPTDD